MMTLEEVQQKVDLGGWRVKLKRYSNLTLEVSTGVFPVPFGQSVLVSLPHRHLNTALTGK